MIVVITLLNCWGIKESATFQNILTASKLCLVLSLFLVALLFTLKSSDVAQANLSLSTSFVGTNDFLSFGSALVACLWSSDDWADLNYLMEDLQHPERVLPRVVLTGLSVVIVAYTLANIAYLSVLSQDTIISSPALAFELGQAVSTAYGVPFVSFLLAFGVALSTLGSVNGSIMTGGKAFYAVARQGKAPRIFATLSAAGSPWPALLAQGGWGVVLLLLPGSSFSSLLSYFGPTSWCFYALTSGAVLVLRREQPNKPRPFRVPLYPLPLVIVFTIAAIIVVGSIIHDPAYTLLSISFVSLAVPVHIIMERFGGWTLAAGSSPATVGRWK